MRTPSLVVSLLALMVVPAAAQVPAGDEFRVNSYTTAVQHLPRVAGFPGGGFVVVWSNASSEAALSGQRLDADGTFRGAEFEVPRVLGGPGSWPAVGTDSRGRFVVAWESNDNGYTTGVFAQRFDAAGARIGAPFLVNSTTTSYQLRPAVAMQRGGSFVVVWASFGQDGSSWGVFGQRFDGAGRAAGGEFRVHTQTALAQFGPSVGSDEAGGFVVAWESDAQDGDRDGVFGQRFHADGTRAGAEFQVNSYTLGYQYQPRVLPQPAGAFVVAWRSFGGGFYPALWSRRFDASGTPQGPDALMHTFTPGPPSYLIDAARSGTGDFTVVWDTPMFDVAGRRFDPAGVPRGDEFRANTAVNAGVPLSYVGSDEVGNLVVAWDANRNGSSSYDVYARRYGGLLPADLAVADSGNGVLEVPEAFTLVTSWRNVNGAAQTFAGRASGATVPAGLALTLTPDAAYGTVAHGATGSCGGPCFAGSLSGTRPAGHVDASFVERILPDAQGQSKKWLLHVGGSFADVPRSSPFYLHVETLLHHGVTAGCAATTYCPAASSTREQMAVFLLAAKEGAGYAPPACTSPVFGDVPASSPFCPWIDELVRRGVTSGCGGGNYCPDAPVTREQMAVFVLRTMDPSLNPPACTTPVFTDVPASSPFCRWIEELARRGITGGCGGGNYCPATPVTREQMAVFLTGTFGLTLYGP